MLSFSQPSVMYLIRHGDWPIHWSQNLEGVCTHVCLCVRFQSDGAGGWGQVPRSAQRVWEAARCSTTSLVTSTAERRARLNWTRYQRTGRDVMLTSCQVTGEVGAGVGGWGAAFEGQGRSGCRFDPWSPWSQRLFLLVDKRTPGREGQVHWGVILTRKLL